MPPSEHRPPIKARMALRAGTGRGNAFTLIELLTVIAIIAVLAALLFPTVNRAMGEARSAKGISNLRQVGVLAFSYAADNNQQLPVQINDWPDYGAPPTARFFQNYLRMNANLPPVGEDLYTSPWLPEIFYDPAVKKGRQHPWGCFGVNDEIIVNAWRCNVRYGQPNGIPLAAISRPSRKVIVCSAKESAPGIWWHSSWSVGTAAWVNGGTLVGGVPDPRHGGRTASLFADGHIDLLDTDSMTRAERADLFLLDP
jgi:prepilin-type N-terminal cleavage/methylation domain-containing protein/prepilin-type processing-associated H-X9-DG protein